MLYSGVRQYATNDRFVTATICVHIGIAYSRSSSLFCSFSLLRRDSMVWSISLESCLQFCELAQTSPQSWPLYSGFPAPITSSMYLTLSAR